MTAWRSGSGARVVLGVTGGIAAYKAVSIARELVVRGHDVRVIPSHSALKFVGAATWEAISRNPVVTEVFDGIPNVTHVALGQGADVVIVAPATAHFLASYAHGLAPDLLATTLLATEAPVVLAPAMHTEMWNHPATQHNVNTLIDRGVTMIGPDSGRLTGDDIGPGRMADPLAIVDGAVALLGSRPLTGMRVLVSAGGTREPIDPVRFIGNRSTGAMGVAFAEAARDRGAEVTLVHADLEVSLPSGVDCVYAPTAARMFEAVSQLTPDNNWIVLSAAVADWTVADPPGDKLSKDAEATLSWPELTKTVDIATHVGHSKRPDQLLVTFSAETLEDDDALIQRATAKGESKKADVVVANRVGPALGFGPTETAVWIVQRSGAPVLLTGSKHTVAGQLIEALLK